MTDIDLLLTRVSNPDTRPFAEEAWRCYGTGAYRAAVTLTWVAVCVDLLSKIGQLAEDGDGEAAEVNRRVLSSEAEGLSAAGIRTMQEIERDLISTAVQLELLDPIAARELERLREDRNLCAHPALRGLGQTFDPRADQARSHLAAALVNLLTLPATQGRRVVDRFISYVADVNFSGPPEYIAQTFLEQVRPAARRRIVDVAVKHALLELEAPDPPGARVIADRMAVCLQAFEASDRELVRDSVAKSLDRVPHEDGGLLIRAFSRLGRLDSLWDAADVPLTERLNSHIPLVVPNDAYGTLSAEGVGLLALTGVAMARNRLSGLESAFMHLHPRARATVMASQVDPYFVPHIPAVLAEAGGWRSAEEIARNAVLPYAHLVTADDLDAILDAWARNEQCRTAGAMPDLAVELYKRTQHLRPGDRASWESFISEVRKREPPPSPYRYDSVEGLIG